MTRPLYEIAREIEAEIGPKKGQWGFMASSYAKPYLNAMHNLDTISDSYYNDSARSVVSYFLANAGTWKGEIARRVKAELKKMLDG